MKTNLHACTENTLSTEPASLALFFLRQRALLYSPDWPRNDYTAQTGLEFIASLLPLAKCSNYTINNHAIFPWVIYRRI